MLRIFLDSCAIIDLREKPNGVEGLGRAPGLLRQLLLGGAGANYRLYASELALAEALVEPMRRLRAVSADRQDEFRRRIAWYDANLRADGPIRAAPLDRRVLMTAADLKARNRSLKMPDAIHAGTALEIAATHFVTRDQKLLDLFAQRAENTESLEAARKPAPVPASEAHLEHLLSGLVQ